MGARDPRGSGRRGDNERDAVSPEHGDDGGGDRVDPGDISGTHSERSRGSDRRDPAVAFGARISVALRDHLLGTVVSVTANEGGEKLDYSVAVPWCNSSREREERIAFATLEATSHVERARIRRRLEALRDSLAGGNGHELGRGVNKALELL